MDIIIAISHILGSITLTVIFSVFIMYIHTFQEEKYKRQLEVEASVSLGIRIEELYIDEYSASFSRFLFNKFSPDLFKNRISDLCGVIYTLWSWLFGLVQIGVFIGVCWYTFTDSLDNAKYAWSFLIFSFLFWISHMILFLSCRLFSGRYPGEAKNCRKTLSKVVRDDGHLVVKSSV